MSYGTLPTGFARKPLPVILAEIEEAMVTEFGPDVIQTSQSPLGQINGLMSDLIAQLWEIAEDAYQSYDPDQAEGLRLDALAKIRILSRATGEADQDLRQAITNADRARIDIQDLYRAIRGLAGVTYAHVFINDTDTVDANGLAPHSVAVAVLGGDDDEIASTVRTYVVPGIGTTGNVRVDTNFDGFCRSVWIVRPTEVPVHLHVEVQRHADNGGCPPAALLAIAETIVATLNGPSRPINGEDVTLFRVRTAGECAYPNVEVVDAVGDRGAISSVSILPVSIAFDEIATFSIANVSVVNA